jgi:hypothetical protein
MVVKAGDAVALARARAGLRLRMGEAGYRRFNELFTSKKMSVHYDDLLTYLVS